MKQRITILFSLSILFFVLIIYTIEFYNLKVTSNSANYKTSFEKTILPQITAVKFEKQNFNRTIYIANYKITLWEVERSKNAAKKYGTQKVDSVSGDSNYNLLFEDDLVKILWYVDSRSIAFLINNKTNRSIKIPWDEAVYIDENGRNHRVMHSGIKYIDRESPQVPSIIVRKGALEDIVFPTDYVYYESGYLDSGWKEKPLLTDVDYHSYLMKGTYPTFDSFKNYVKSNIGKTYQVLLPLQIENIINDYVFTFKIKDVTTKQQIKTN